MITTKAEVGSNVLVDSGGKRTGRWLKNLRRG